MEELFGIHITMSHIFIKFAIINMYQMIVAIILKKIRGNSGIYFRIKCVSYYIFQK